MPSTRALRRFEPRRSPPTRQSSQAAAAAAKEKEEEEEASPWLPSSSSTSSSSSSASALFKHKHSAALSAAGPRGGSGTRVYPLRDFPGGDAATLGGAFRDNVRWLLKQWSSAPGSGSAWRALLSDERTGALAPIVAVEELAAASPSPLCDLCRCAAMPPKKNKKQQKKKNPPPNIQADVYKVHKVIFKGKQTLVVGHNEGGQSPLLALSNLLLLRHGHSNLETFEMADETLWVTPKKLHSFVCRHLSHVANPRYHGGAVTERHREQLMRQYKAGLDHLRLGHPAGGAYPRFSSIKDFVYLGKEKAPLELLLPHLSVSMYHALVPDPKDTDLCSATKGSSSVELALELEEYKEAGVNNDDERMRVVRDFLDGPDLTLYGLALLREEAPEDNLLLFYLNNEFHVVYKKGGQLYLLAAEEDMFNEHPDIMWIMLDGEFNTENLAKSTTKLTSTFSPVDENLISTQKQLIEEVEAENRTLKMGNERKQDKAETSVVLEEEAKTETSEVQEEAHTSCVESKVETVFDSHDSPKVVVKEL